MGVYISGALLVCIFPQTSFYDFYIIYRRKLMVCYSYSLIHAHVLIPNSW